MPAVPPYLVLLLLKQNPLSRMLSHPLPITLAWRLNYNSNKLLRLALSGPFADSILSGFAATATSLKSARLFYSRFIGFKLLELE